MGGWPVRACRAWPASWDEPLPEAPSGGGGREPGPSAPRAAGWGFGPVVTVVPCAQHPNSVLQALGSLPRQT